MLTRDAVGQIKAAEGVYRAADVARYYGVHRSTILNIWRGRRHVSVPATDFPDIDTRPSRDQLAEDLELLLGRGMSMDEAADALGVSRRTVYLIRGLFL